MALKISATPLPQQNLSLLAPTTSLSVSKVLVIALAFFVTGGQGAFLPFARAPCNAFSARVSYREGWTCPDPSWAASALAQNPNLESFTVKTREGEVMTALVNIEAPNCVGATRYVEMLCPSKS
jgi:hypothetical protein